VGKTGDALLSKRRLGQKTSRRVRKKGGGMKTMNVLEEVAGGKKLTVYLET